MLSKLNATKLINDMEEIFELIKAFNRLKEKIVELICKIDLLLKSNDSCEPSAPARQYLPSDYVDEEGACSILHICPRSLAYLRAEGSIPYIKKGRRIQYLVGDLHLYLEHIKKGMKN
jgi:hypothetical protein